MVVKLPYFSLPPIMIPTMYVLLISARGISKLLDMAQENPCLWKEQRVRTHSLLAGWKHQSLQPNTCVLSVFQQTHRCSTIMESCMVCVHMRKCQFNGIKTIWLVCISYNRTQTVLAIYHCPSSHIFPEFLAHVRSRIYSRWRINKGLGPEGSLLPARLEFCRPWGAVSKTVMNV